MLEGKEAIPFRQDYIPEVWKEYTVEELMWWVLNLTRRATHRLDRKKSVKDLKDARVYLEMMIQAVEEEDELA